MARTVVLAIALAATLAFAGCTGGETKTTTPPTGTTPPATTTQAPTTTTPPATTTPPTTTTPPVTNQSYGVETIQVPSLVAIGQGFSFTMFVNGSTTVSSDHIGAHFGRTSSAAPSTDVYDKTCQHQAGTLGGQFTVNCTISEEGTWYLRGHARVTRDNVTFHYWGPEREVEARFYNLTLEGVPTAAVANQTVTFTLNVTGNETVESNHIGAHWSWNSTSSSPSTRTYESACQHSAGNVPGKFTVICTFPAGGLAPAKVYVRGHLRVTTSGLNADWWSREAEITVSPGLV